MLCVSDDAARSDVSPRWRVCESPRWCVSDHHANMCSMHIERRERRDASILHADLDSFYASVEQRDDPSLRGRPVLVGGGVVLAASYEAKARGVRSPMPGHEARALCPDAVVVAPRFEAYMEASREVFDIFHDTTPVVEGISVDEAFLDVGGLGRISGTPRDVATTIRSRVRDEVGLPITVGGARSKPWVDCCAGGRMAT